MTENEIKTAAENSVYSHRLLNPNTILINLDKLERSCETMNIYLSREQQMMITRLLAIHFTGKLHISRSSQDIELSIPDPELLIKDGPKELYSRHLYVNISKVSKPDNDLTKNPMACCCIKNMKFYSIDELLSMKPIALRDNISWNKTKYLSRLKDHTLILPDVNLDDLNSDTSFLDEDTKIVSPGECIALSKLSEDHPAIIYLKSRGYTDINALEEQFNARFCLKENPQFKHLFGRDDEKSIAEFNPLSFFTPQGRIIFSSMMNGRERLWQARVIETQILDSKYYYMFMGENDPRNNWVKVATYDKTLETFKTVSKFNNSIIKRKYIIAPGSKSSECLLGFDAAIKWNDAQGRKDGNRLIGICEGVLDAARLGPPFCSVMGAGISTQQYSLIRRTFNKVIYASDHDSAGKTLASALKQKIEAFGDNDNIQIKPLDYSNKYKDLGDIKDMNIIESLKQQVKEF